MKMRIIQVPVDPQMLAELDAVAREKGLTRSALIRAASKTYLRREAEATAAREYEESYRRVPESPEWSEAQLAVLPEILPKEAW